MKYGVNTTILTSKEKATAFYGVAYYIDMTDQIVDLMPVFPDYRLALYFCDTANAKHAERVYFVTEVDKKGDKV